MDSIVADIADASKRRVFYRPLASPDIPCESCSIRGKSIFCDLGSPDLRTLCVRKNENVYHKGQAIFYEGTRPTGLYILHSGKVKICKKGLWGREQIVRLAKPGELLTYRALAGVSHYVVSAIAIEDSIVCYLETEDFLKVMRQNPALAFRVIQLLSEELDKAEITIRNLAQKTVRQRLAETLLHLQRRYGMSSSDDELIDVRLSREDIANIIGTATETVVRLLSDFKKKNIIASEGQKIWIMDQQRLERMAQPDGGPRPS